MNTNSLTLCRTHGKRGVALIIVLSMLVLLAGIVVAFMTAASTERAASSANAGIVNARQIADSTVSLVIGQIRDATSVPNDNTVWASQPGAIRTFAGTISGKTQSGTLRSGSGWDDYSPSSSDSVFKLYSSDSLKVTAADYTNTELPAETDVIEKWSATDVTANLSKFPEFVDLNVPILFSRLDLDANGKVVEPHYPIVDPRAKLDKLDKEANGIVEGFDAKLTFDPQLSMVKLNDGIKKSEKSDTKVPYLPLPVKWMYIMRDGTIGSASAATKENPIVGRTAFWTDDECSKLNINTASEGTFWDTPTASSMQECGPYSLSTINPTDRGLNLAGSQAVKNEFQRYPGHPATTCLSPVLGWLWDVTFSGASPTPSMGPYANSTVNTKYNTFKEAIYQISPYTPFGKYTSLGGTFNTDFPPGQEPKGGLQLDVRTKHLYASVDEMAFKAARFTTGSLDPQLNSPLTPDALERVRFFLTANSRVPELNVFGRPRVTIWPVNRDPKYRTSFDDAFIFTSTLSKASNVGAAQKRYCLTRGDAKSALNDLSGDPRNLEIYRYLQTMTSRNVPGFGASFQTKWTAAERDEVLMLIFDYMRTVNMEDTGTATRQTGGVTNVFAPYTPKFFYKPPPADQYSRYDRSYDWSGQVTPLRKDATISPNSFGGMGRFVVPSEVAMVFHTTTAPNPLPPGTTASTKWIRATLLIEMTTAMPGYPGIRDTYWTKIRPKKFADGTFSRTKVRFTNAPADVDINLCYDKNPNFFADPLNGIINVVNVSNHEVAQGRAFCPTLGFANSLFYFPEHKGPTMLTSDALEDPSSSTKNPNRIGANDTPAPKEFDNMKVSNRTYYRQKNALPAETAGTVGYYPYVSDKIAVVGDGKTVPSSFSILAGAYDIEIYAGEAPDDDRSYVDKVIRSPIQVVHIEFPPNKTEAINLPTSPDISKTSRFYGGTYIENYGQLNGTTITTFITGGDVVRSMELTCAQQNKTTLKSSSTGPTSGDVRLAAARSELPADFYAPRQGKDAYYSATAQLHGLTRGHCDPEPNYLSNGSPYPTLAAGGGVRSNKPPILPLGISGVFRSDGGIGDWDRGLSKHMSGAFGNKVDEGNLKWDRGGSNYAAMPYFRGRGIEETGQTFFTPNRQLASPVMFGSLPTGVVRNRPWETLLFRPNRETKKHPGAETPPDHMILDLFHMPVVEPYAISEPFSTAGKVNMNYVMAPFGYAKNTGTNPDTKTNRTYIRRDTALRGVLRSTFIMAVPTGQGDGGHTEDPQGQSTPFRFPIDANRTLEQLETRLQFKNGQYPLFRSPSEICTVDLYPKSLSGASAPSVADAVNGWDTFWNTSNGLTGDNMRERPYAHIYPRLTTKSNTYTVYMRCQSIRKAPNSPPGVFNPKLDAIVGEYRGSATIERFIDPNDPALADYKENDDKVDGYYRYRVINTKQFAPK